MGRQAGWTLFNWLLIGVILSLGLRLLLLRSSEMNSRECEVKPAKPEKYLELTLSMLRQYDGVKNPRILIALDQRLFDVTSKGRDHYGPGITVLISFRWRLCRVSGKGC